MSMNIFVDGLPPLYAMGVKAWFFCSSYWKLYAEGRKRGMGNEALFKIFIFIVVYLLTGHGRNDGKTIFGTFRTDATVKYESEELLDAFLAGEIPASYGDGTGLITIFDLMPVDEEDDFNYYSVGERIDLDNDGENEQIVNGPYGGKYFDARDGKVYVLAEGEGTSGELFYTYYDNAVWIVHSDTTHMGRKMYWLTRYDGEGNVTDEFQLSAEYWDSPDSKYDENSDFTYRDEKISMEEYETLRKEIIGW
ncbi:MAG: hypothetical protein K1W35_22910 [Lachnospiraceae bacterium]